MSLRPFTLERFFAKHEHEISHMFSSSDCETMTVGELLSFEPEALERLRDVRLGYIDTRGALSLRELVAAQYESITPDEVLIHVGAQEAIFTFMNAVLGSGDHVVAQSPGYQSVFEVPRAIGCEVTRWGFRPDAPRMFDVEELAALVTSKTCVIAVNSPHNPTGATFTSDEQARIVAIAEKNDALLLSDEVYRGLEREGTARSMADLSPNVVALGVLSKAFGLAGLRIGWLATKNAAVLARAAELKDFTTICAPSPSEFLAEVALRNAAPILARNRALVRENTERFDAATRRLAHKVRWQRPEGGPVALATLVGEGASVEALVERALTQDLLVVQASHFGVEGPRFRVGLGRKDFEASLARFEASLDAR